MEPSKNMEIKVGGLVAAGLVLFIITVIMLGSDTNFLKPTYTLRVQFDTVQGLGQGSVVQLLGIPIGNVKQIKLGTTKEGKNKLVVFMQIDRAYQNRITEGSIAGVRTQGALGDKYIYIMAGPHDGKPIHANGYIPAEQRGDIFDTISNSADKVDKAFLVIEEAHKLLANLNSEGRSMKVMENLVDATSELKKTLKDLRGGENHDDKLRSSLTHLASVLEKIDNGQGTLGALINDRSVFENIKRMLGGSDKEKFIKSLVRETIQSSESR
jgi:phospholipid/cholesterol/gamma-HCH transport system substrate-binding protein